MITKIIKLPLAIALLIFIMSCNINQEKTGSLIMNFPMNNNRALVPGISMDAAGYDIIGTGPNGASFTINANQPAATIDGLAFGDWTITAEARNADGTIIGHGESTTTVHAGETSTVNIIVTPLVGTGTLDLTINWNAGDTESPSIESELIPAVGNGLPLSFSISGGNRGTYINNGIATGYSTLIVKLMDGNPANTTPILTMGAVEIVRIIKDQTTYGVFDFSEINHPGGSIVIGITPELGDPIPVTMRGQQSEIVLGSSMTVSADVPPDAGNVVYVWYLNGETVTTGASYTVAGLPKGVYRLDVTAFTTDGKRAGSASHVFHVVDVLSSPTPTLTASSTPTNTASSTPTNTAASTPTNTASSTPTNTASPTPTNTASPTPTNTASPTPTNTASSTPTNTALPTPTNTASPTPTNTALPTPTNTASPTPLPGSIYWIDINSSIRRSDFNGANIVDLITNLNQPRAIALNIPQGKMYWTEGNGSNPGLGGIKRANLDGSNREPVITGLTYPSDLAIDSTAAKLYWTEGSHMYRSNLDGTVVEIFSPGIGTISGLAIDFQNHMAYAAVTDSTTGIYRFNYSASPIVPQLLVSSPSPQGLALDLTGGRMYWTDPGNFSGRIRYANLNGSSVVNLNIASFPVKIALAVNAGTMYWTDINTSIYRATLTGGNVVELIADRSLGISLKID
jgi:hypothetical protein